MLQKITFALPLIVFLSITWWCPTIHAQYYQIYGPQFIDEPCLFYDYTIETSEEIIKTEWSLIPSNGSWLGGYTYDITIQFPASGTYILIATSSLVGGTEVSDSLRVDVFGQISPIELIGCYVPDSVTGCYQVCALSTSTLYLPFDAQWSISGAESFTTIGHNTVEIVWGQGGTGIVYYNSGGCDASQCFEILPLAVADFSTSPSSMGDTITVCKGEEIIFQNLSISGFSYRWEFGDGSTGNSFNTTHSFDEEGFYVVTLTSETICNCTDQKQIIVHVLPAAVPTLDCVNTVCPGTRQRYTSTSDSCTLFDWSVSSNGTVVNGGGMSDDFIEIIWDEGPDGIINLSVDDCTGAYCSTTNSFRIPILTTDGPIKGDEVVCSGEIVSYEVPYFPGTHYKWEVGSFGEIVSGGNSNSVTIKWNDGNIATTTFVSVKYENCFLECKGEDFLPVSITRAYRLEGDTEVCQNGQASVQALSQFGPPAQVQWHLENDQGDAVFVMAGINDTFTHIFSYPSGNYEWVATNASSSYCNTEVRLQIQITALPTAPLAILGETIICPGVPYGFTIESSGNFATLWTVTDGASVYTYPGQTFQHSFGSVLPFNIEAVHTDIQSPDCISDPISISLQKLDTFSISGTSEVCFNDITAYSFVPVSGVDFVWEIIPPDHAELKRSDQNIVEIFWTQTGPVTLRLTTCSTVFDKNIVVHALPEFNLEGIMVVCENETVAVTTDQSGMIHTWYNDADNVIDITDPISLASGNYSVSVKDVLGCKSEKIFDIASYSAPSIKISTASPNVYCTSIPAGVEVVANTDGANYIFTWFKDNIIIGSGSASYPITDFGTYHAEVTNQYGCKSISDEITFYDCCFPDDCSLAPPCFLNGCSYFPQDFDIVTSGTDCQSRSYTPLWPGITPDTSRWSIFSLTQGTLAIIQEDVLLFDYSYPGYYIITMTGIINGYPYLPGECGHFQELRDTIRAVADFNHQGQCAGELITFEDMTTFLPDEIIGSWSWDFGDPASGGDNTSSMQDPVHIFNTGGDYDIRITAALLSGCSVTKVKRIHISSGPLLSPLYDPLFCQMEALAFYLPGNVFKVEWEFGDVSSGIQNISESNLPFHTYELPGIYPVKVSAVDVFGCKNQTTIPVDIRANTLSGNININPASLLCFGDTAILTAPAGGISWIWNTTETEEQILIFESSDYNVLIKDQFQCSYSPPSSFIPVSPKPVTLIKAREIFDVGQYGVWESSLQLCEGNEFELHVFSSGDNTYEWSDGTTGQVLILTQEGGNLPGPGRYQFEVLAWDNLSGCVSDSAFIEVEIYALPINPLISISSGSGCSHTENIMQVTNPESGIDYVWSDGQKGISILTKNAGSYFVIATNENGCSRKSNLIEVNQAASVDEIPGGCYIKCDPLEVCLPSINDVTSWSIFQNDVLYANGTVWPSNYMITTDGSYTIEVTTSNGCIATSDPLDIVLYPGVGSITVLTYLDVDQDGAISAVDVLMPGIPIQIISGDGLHEGNTNTLSNGGFVFEDYPVAAYIASFNPALLPSQWRIIMDSIQTNLVTCDDSVVVSLLLDVNCSVAGTDLFIESCPGEEVILGDSIWSDIGQYTVHMMSSTGCDSVFEINILWPDSLEIGTTVWADIDHNGILSPADTVVEGITIVIDRMINQAPYIEVTDAFGMVHGVYPAGNYGVSIVSSSLPAGFVIVYGSEFISDTVCGKSHFDFLLTPGCSDVFIFSQVQICNGDSVLIENQVITNAGVYSFMLNPPGSGCDSFLEIYVTVFPEPIIESFIDWNCLQQGYIELTVEGTSPFIYSWDPFLQGDSIVSGLIDGVYSVTISDGNGCAVSETFTIQSPSPSIFDIPSQYEIHEGDSIEISVYGTQGLNGLHFQWTPSNFLNCDTCAQTIAYPDSITTYTVNITDADDCVYMLSTTVEVTHDSALIDQIYIPNVFSPNDDGINDRFTFFSFLPDVYIHEFTLMDRWGEMVFSISDIRLADFAGWDGVFREKPLNPQVFVYFAKARLSDGREVKLAGDVTLVR